MQAAFERAISEALPAAAAGRISPLRRPDGSLELHGRVEAPQATRLNVAVDRFVRERGSEFALSGRVHRSGLDIFVPQVRLGDVTSQHEREILAEHSQNDAYLNPDSMVDTPVWNVDFVQASDRRYARHIRPVYGDDDAATVDAVAAFVARWGVQQPGLVVHTGAGISSSAGIATYREGSSRSVALEAALPTYAHFALVALAKAGAVDYVCSQNVDGLHRRSGLPSDRLSELHGNCFIEACSCCQPPMEFLRPFSVCEGRSRRPKPTDPGVTANEKASGISHITGRTCPKGGGPLRDSVIHFQESLPVEALQEGERRSRAAALNLVIGSSLLVRPASELPFAGSGPVVIISKSCTGKDMKALRRGGALLRAPADAFMERLVWHVSQGCGGLFSFPNDAKLMRTLHDRVRERDIAVLRTSEQVPYGGGADGGVVPDEFVDWTRLLRVRQTHEPAEEDGWHLWSLSVEPANGDPAAMQAISAVRFKLHPTFSPPVKEVQKPPFTTGQLKGWGTFQVTVEVSAGPLGQVETSFPLSFAAPETVRPLTAAVAA